eukprot:scaffold412855_cov16-Prasinocladus_malaysianus.AAC.1
MAWTKYCIPLGALEPCFSPKSPTHASGSQPCKPTTRVVNQGGRKHADLVGTQDVLWLRLLSMAAWSLRIHFSYTKANTLGQQYSRAIHWAPALTSFVHSPTNSDLDVIPPIMPSDPHHVPITSHNTFPAYPTTPLGDRPLPQVEVKSLATITRDRLETFCSEKPRPPTTVLQASCLRHGRLITPLKVFPRSTTGPTSLDDYCH